MRIGIIWTVSSHPLHLSLHSSVTQCTSGASSQWSCLGNTRAFDAPHALRVAHTTCIQCGVRTTYHWCEQSCTLPTSNASGPFCQRIMSCSSIRHMVALGLHPSMEQPAMSVSSRGRFGPPLPGVRKVLGGVWVPLTQAWTCGSTEPL